MVSAAVSLGFASGRLRELGIKELREFQMRLRRRKDRLIDTRKIDRQIVTHQIPPNRQFATRQQTRTDRLPHTLDRLLHTRQTHTGRTDCYTPGKLSYTNWHTPHKPKWTDRHTLDWQILTEFTAFAESSDGQNNTHRTNRLIYTGRTLMTRLTQIGQIQMDRLTQVGQTYKNG